MTKITLDRSQKIPNVSPTANNIFCWARVWLICLAMMAVSGCGPMYSPPQMVKSEPPKVSYNFNSDQELIKANSKARLYCSQYASTPRMQGTITMNPDGTKTVEFECVKTAMTPPPPPPPMSYSYHTDIELLQAIQSADAYCARTGQVASTSTATNPDGTRTLMFQCVPR